MRRLPILVLVAALVLAVLPLPGGAVSFGAMGSKVITGGMDFNPQFTGTAVAAATLCARDTGVGASATDDLFYMNMDGAGTVVQSFDIRLTTAESRSAGTIVGSGDTDVGQTFNSVVVCTALASNLQFLEVDGLPGWTAGDMLVWSTDTTLGAGDIRLSSSSGTSQDSQSLSAGTIVAVGNADLSNIANNNGLYPDCTGSPPQGAACVSSAILQGAGEFVLRHYDANLNAAVDTGDVVMAARSAAGTPAPLSPSINDVYLYGSTFGTKLTRSSADYLLEPEVVCAGAITAGCHTVAPTLGYVRIGAGDSNCDRLFMHFREYESNDLVQPDDVLLYSTTATCTAIPPASSPTPGTRVTTVASHFQGTAFQAAPVAMAGLVYYVDVNGNSRFDLTDPVYMDKPAAFGGGALLTVTGGDQRLTAVTAGASSFPAGTIVGASDADVSAFSGSTKNPDAANAWYIRKLNNDGANEIALTTVASVMFHDVNANDKWDPVTESVYRDVGATGNGCGATGTSDCVNSGDFLLYAGSDTALTASSTTPIDCTVGPPADCSFLATTLDTSTEFRVTGTDATVDASRGETVFYSRDLIVNDEDFALSAATGSSFAAGAVSCAANGCDNEGLHASDVMYLSRCDAVAGCPGRLMLGDVQLAPTMGTRTTSSGADYVPSLLDLPTAGGVLLRYNRGESANTADDTFYASTDGGTPTTQDVRLTAFTSLLAGTIVTSSNTEELQATMVADSTDLASRIASRDIDGLTGYTLNDAVYANNAGAGMGGSAGDSILSAYDVRLTAVTGGSQTFTAGTMVFAGNGDLTGGTAFTGLGSWLLGFHDDNLNGVVDTGDVVYALPPGSAALSTFPQPPLGAIRLSGSGVATGGGTGGGSNPAPTTSSTQTTTATSTDTATDTSTATSTETSTSTETTSATTTTSQAPSAATLNQQLQASLDVARDGEANVLTWSDTGGEDGYQVFGSTSPFVLVAKLPAGTTTYRDEGAGKDRRYLVTAVVAGAELTADQVNGGQVPGYDAAPEGEPADEPKKKGFIPALSPVLVLGLVAALALLARRRLA